MFSILLVTLSSVIGFDFIVIAPLLPSLCSFSFVFGCGVLFLVSSSVFLLMIVQQLVVIPVLSQEGVLMIVILFSLVIYLEVRLLGHMVILFLIFCRTSILLSRMARPSSVQALSFLHILVNT